MSADSDIIYTLSALRADILREAEEADFVRDEYAKGLRFAAKLIEDEIEMEKDWQRINALTPEELRAELAAEGYTQDKLDQLWARIKESLDAKANGKDA